MHVASRLEMTRKAILNQLEITFIKGSGPGGQNRNKRFSGVRVRDPLTGLVGTATERRSQNQNLNKALERLEEKIEKRAFKPKVRKKTVPNQSNRKQRVFDKKARGQIKKLRSKKSDEW